MDPLLYTCLLTSSLGIAPPLLISLHNGDEVRSYYLYFQILQSPLIFSQYLTLLLFVHSNENTL